MRRARFIALLALAPAWSVISAGQLSAPRIVAAHVPLHVSANGEYLIQFTPHTAQRALATEHLRRNGISLKPVAPGLFVSLAIMTPEEAEATAAAPGVVAVDPNDELHAAATQPNPPWGLDRSDQTDLPLDGSLTYSDSAGAGTTIYIIDSGINATHNEFTGRLVAGYDDVQDGHGTNDCSGHGTHVAGIAAGTTFGLAKLATVVPVRVLGCNGRASLESVIRGINWVIGNHVSGRAVANLSISGDAGYTTLDDAVGALVADGVAVAVAAGNGNGANACDTSPSRSPAALTVGATTAQDTRSTFSSIGPCVELFAPGTGILSAWYDSPTATNIQSGTSMAAPFVAGALAMLWTDNTAFSALQVQSVVVASAVPNRLTNVGAGSPNLLLHLPQPLADVVRGADANSQAQRCDFSPLC